MLKNYFHEIVEKFKKIEVKFGGARVHPGYFLLRAGQGIRVLKQSILGQYRPSSCVSGVNILFKDTFL